MQKKYTGSELLQATRNGLILSGSKFKCRYLKDLVFVYDKGFSGDEDDFTNYWIIKNGCPSDGCLNDVVRHKDLDDLTFKLVKHKTIKVTLHQLFCKHEWEDGSNLPGCQTFVCSKCGKEVFYNPKIGFF